MFARVSTYEGRPHRTEEQITEQADRLAVQVLPAIHRLPGFRGAYYLVDRESGKAMSVTLWSTREEMQASEEEGERLRRKGAESGRGGDVPVAVERFEVVVAELAGAVPIAAE